MDLNQNTRSCLASATAWRTQAENLREHAALPHLPPHTAAMLRGEADAADRQAEWWLSGAGETNRPAGRDHEGGESP